jgi:hypothetical protein
VIPPCPLCGQPVHDPDLGVVEVAGFELKSQQASRRGGSDIVLREPTGRVAHPDCVVRARAGLSPLQEQLV